MYVIDTNIYIRALRDAEFGRHLGFFVEAALPQLWLSAVVAFELAAGAEDERHEREIERWLLRPFRNHHRILIPTGRTWRIAAEIHRRIRHLGGYRTTLDKRGFLGDVLIAASCRVAGATLVTANRADFELIDRVIGFRFVSAFPQL